MHTSVIHGHAWEGGEGGSARHARAGDSEPFVSVELQLSLGVFWVDRRAAWRVRRPVLQAQLQGLALTLCASATCADG